MVKIDDFGGSFMDELIKIAADKGWFDDEGTPTKKNTETIYGNTVTIYNSLMKIFGFPNEVDRLLSKFKDPDKILATMSESLNKVLYPRVSKTGLLSTSEMGTLKKLILSAQQALANPRVDSSYPLFDLYSFLSNRLNAKITNPKQRAKKHKRKLSQKNDSSGKGASERIFYVSTAEKESKR
jgi:hypothetical protein